MAATTQKKDDKSRDESGSQPQQPCEQPKQLERSDRGSNLMLPTPFSLFRRLLDDFTSFAMPTVARADITRRDEFILVQVDLPGISPEDVRVTVDDDLLIIEGERRAERDVREGDVVAAERVYGRFRRVFQLPENADADSIEAQFENGVLEIELRAPERKRGRAIEIKQGIQQRAPQTKSSTSH
jgi:HSP20 family molecular chaperone IbpA